MRQRRTGYAYHGKGTPPLKDQIKALVDAGCVKNDIFADEAPDRINREALICFGIETGDVIVIAKPSIIGSGVEDTAKAVRDICDQGALIEVVGQGARSYKTDAEIEEFAGLALRVSRSVNARNMLASRSRAGRKLKTEDLSDEQWATVKFFWLYDGVKQQPVIDYVQHVLGFKDVTRQNIANRITREMKK